jgi:ribonuclease HII
MNIGIDEVGRGCVAGPVVAAAVVIDDSFDVLVSDSKLLSANRREILDKEVKKKCIDFSISVINSKTVDEINIHKASLLAMEQAYLNLHHQSGSIKCDGKFLPNIDGVVAHINGDKLYTEISAASIIAKVYRDHLMNYISLKYPNYHFDKHKGYLTKLHLEAIEQYGPCNIHRLSFKPFS